MPTADRIRSLVIGYNDAALTAAKEQISDELDLDPSDMDEVLATRYRLERCTCCGHWYDQADCSEDDGRGGFECAACATED